MIEINISANNALPYVTLKQLNIKPLIDTGSSKYILKPTIAEKYFPQCIYNNKNTIKTALGSQQTLFQATLPLFKEYNIHNEIDFILFDFHDFYDGIIGLSDLRKLNLNIDLINNVLVDHCAVFRYAIISQMM